MSKNQLMLDPEDVGPADESLLDLLQEGRITAPYAASETGYNTQYIRDRLTRLVEHGHVTKIYDGLYELVSDPRPPDDREQGEEEVKGVLRDSEALVDLDHSEESESSGARFEEMDIPNTVDAADAEQAVLAARKFLKQKRSASMRDIVSEIMPEHSLGYDIPDLEPGDRYRGAWWRRVVKPGLETYEDIQKPTGGQSEWRYKGDSE